MPRRDLGGDDSLGLRAERARTEIASGALRGQELWELLCSVPARDRDAWTDEILGLDPLPPDAPDLPRGSVPYLPCGVDDILALVREVPVRPADELVDLGSGLGRVAILVHLISGARARGIEIQEHLVGLARARCAALHLPDVSFVHANAAETELVGGIFFLYSPFNGPMLAAVVRRLEDLAKTRPIVVCTVDVELRGLAWLHPRASSNASLFLYDSHRE